MLSSVSFPGLVILILFITLIIWVVRKLLPSLRR